MDRGVPNELVTTAAGSLKSLNHAPETGDTLVSYTRPGMRGEQPGLSEDPGKG